MDEPEIEAKIALGLEQMQQGEAVAALATFDEVLAVDPTHAQVLYFKGCLLSESGDDEAAIAMFAKSAEFAGDMASLPYFNLGNALQRQGNLSESLQAFPIRHRSRPDHGRRMDQHGTNS